MTLKEFKAWFDGFTENMDGAPSKKQWARITERVAEIDDKPISFQTIERHYHDYRPYYVPTYSPVWVSSGATIDANSVTCSNMGRADAAMLTAEATQ